MNNELDELFKDAKSYFQTKNFVKITEENFDQAASALQGVIDDESFRDSDGTMVRVIVIDRSMETRRFVFVGSYIAIDSMSGSIEIIPSAVFERSYIEVIPNFNAPMIENEID